MRNKGNPIVFKIRPVDRGRRIEKGESDVSVHDLKFSRAPYLTLAMEEERGGRRKERSGLRHYSRFLANVCAGRVSFFFFHREMYRTANAGIIWQNFLECVKSDKVAILCRLTWSLNQFSVVNLERARPPWPLWVAKKPFLQRVILNGMSDSVYPTLERTEAAAAAEKVILFSGKEK